MSERRREPRIPLLGLHGIRFQSDLARYPQAIQVANLSSHGIGFLHPPQLRLPETGEFPGQLTLAAGRFQLSPEIVYSGEQGIGCRLQNPGGDFRAALEDYLMVELAALQLSPSPLQEIDLEVGSPLNRDAGGSTAFYRGGNNCDLLVQRQGAEITAFRMLFFGNLIEYQKERGLSVNELIDDLETAALATGEVSSVQKNVRALHPLMKRALLRFVDYAEVLDLESRQFVHQIIAAYPLQSCAED